MHAVFLQMCSLLFLQVAAILPYTTLSPIGFSYSYKWQPYFLTQHYHRLVFLRETGRVFFELRTESVHKMCSNFSIQSHLILECV